MKFFSSLSSTFDQIEKFTLRNPTVCFHVVDMPYRLCSPAAQDAANSRVWTDEQGEVIGFGVVQVPFSSLDWAAAPGHERLHEEIVAWGVASLNEVAQQRGESFGYLLDSRSDHDAVAEAHGFVLDDWYMRSLALKFEQAPSAAPIPAGFKIRPLRGEDEVADYVALHRAAFQSRNMTTDWRSRTLSHPNYVPHLDLVAEDEAGALAAFCIGWLCELDGMVVGQIEPLGVLPEYQGRGLGRAILLHSLQQFYKSGAKRLLIDAESSNPASQGLYEASGFREFSRTYKYFRRFEPA